MTEITASQTKEAIESKLKEWVDPENEGYGTILSLNFSEDGQSAYALVQFPYAIEINFLFYTPFGQQAEVSGEYLKPLFDTDYDEHANTKNALIVELTREVYNTFIKRFK